MPAVIGHAIDDGVSAKDSDAARPVGRDPVRHRPAPGGRRDHAAPLRGHQLADRGLPRRPARHPPDHAPRRHAAASRLDRRGGRDRDQRPLPRRPADGRLGPLRRRHRLVHRGRGDPAADLGDARAGRAPRRTPPDARHHPDPQPAAEAERPPAPPDGRPLQHRERHRRRAARAARDRWRAGLPRPLPPRVPEHPSGRRPGRPDPVGARRAAGLPAGSVRRGRGVDRRALRRRGHHLPRPAGRLLRLLRVLDDPAADRDRVRQQDHPRPRRGGPDLPGARHSSPRSPSRPCSHRRRRPAPSCTTSAPGCGSAPACSPRSSASSPTSRPPWPTGSG